MSIQELINNDLDERIDISLFMSKNIEVMIKNCDETCPKCHSKNVNVKTKQTRSADEGATNFYTCIDCGYVWRKYN